MIKIKVRAKIYTLEGDQITIGRDRDCDITLRDSSISRKHAVITQTEQGYVVKDLDSRNGIRINGNKLKQFLIKKEDVIGIGNQLLQVLDVEFIPENTMMKLKKRTAAYREVKRGLARRLFFNVGIPAVCATALFVAILIVSQSFNSNEQEEEPEGPTQEEVLTEKWLGEMKAFNASIQQREITMEDIRECKAIGDRYKQVADEEQMQDILNTLNQRYLEAQVEKNRPLWEARGKIETYLEKKDFASAVRVVEDLRKSSKASISEIDILARKIDFNAQRVYKKLEKDAHEYKRMGRFDKADKLYKNSLVSFKGTRYFILVESSQAMLPFQELTVTSLAKNELQGELAKVVSKIESVAPKDIKKVLNELPDYPKPPKVIVTILKRMEGRTVPFGNDSVVLNKVTDSWIKIRAGSTVQELPLTKFNPKVIWQLVKKEIKIEDYPKVTEYLKAGGDKQEADRLEYEYKVYMQKKEFEEAQKKLLAKIDKLLGEIGKAKTLTDINDVYKQASPYLSNQDLPAEKLAAMKKKLIDVLLKLKDYRLEQIKRTVKPASNLRDLKIKLEQARKKALRLINDKNAYPYGRQKGKGQKDVDALVNKVKSIWESKESIKLDSSSSRMIDEISKLNEMLKGLGVKVKEEEKDIKQLIESMPGQNNISIKRFVLTPQDRELLEYNDRVDKYNEYFRNNIIPKECAGAPKDIVDQVYALNKYREMMGRRKLILDARLVRAAQDHTQAMAKAGRIWHRGSDGSPSSRAQKHGYRGSLGENVAMGRSDPVSVHWQWYKSSGHHRNMLSSSWNIIGVGHVGRFWTQKFGRVRDMPRKFYELK